MINLVIEAHRHTVKEQKIDEIIGPILLEKFPELANELRQSLKNNATFLRR